MVHSLLHYTNKSILDVEGEVWEDINGFVGFYKVSIFGRVKSVSRVTNQNRVLEEKILSQFFNIDKYLCVNLYKNGDIKQVKVHRLVGEAFIPNPENKPQVNHKFGIKIDNRVTELEWHTHKENNDHAWSMGLKWVSEEQKRKVSAALKGGLSYRAKTVLNQETGIYYDTIGEAAYSANVDRRTLNNMLVGKRPNKTSFINV